MRVIEDHESSVTQSPQPEEEKQVPREAWAPPRLRRMNLLDGTMNGGAANSDAQFFS